jgi:hypothetical protein
MALIKMVCFFVFYLTDTFPEEFILLILLITWLENVNFNNETQVVELFAGVARVAKFGILKGYRAVAVDILYCKSNPRAMDMNSAPGFVQLDCIYHVLL